MSEKNLVTTSDGIEGSAGDSAFENRVAISLRELDREDRLQCLVALLTDERAVVRYMGLRLIRRVALDRVSLDQLFALSHGVLRYTEIQHWYQAFLARYPAVRLAKLLILESGIRDDAGFKELRVRAVEMCRVPSKQAKRAALRLLQESSE